MTKLRVGLAYRSSCSLEYPFQVTFMNVEQLSLLLHSALVCFRRWDGCWEKHRRQRASKIDLKNECDSLASKEHQFSLVRALYHSDSEPTCISPATKLVTNRVSKEEEE